jgi:hypothetical protein
MSLRLASNRDMFAYLQSGKFQSPAPLQELQFAFVGQSRPSHVYLDRFGHFQGNNGTVSPGFMVVRFDPELIDDSSDVVGIVSHDLRGWFMGDYEPSTGSQSIFTRQSSENVYRQQVYEDPASIFDNDPFPAINYSSDRAGTASGTDGYWSTVPQSNNIGNVVFFPDWGPGYALYNDGDFRSTEDSILYQDAPFLVNLTTGLSEPIDLVGAFPTTYTASPAHKYQGNKIFGEANTRSQNIQFIPDANSKHIAPKGRILQSIQGLEPVTNEFRYYCLFYDWNPTGAPGSPARNHLSLVQQTRCIMTASATSTTILPATPAREITGMTNPLGDSYVLFDNQRGRLVMFHSVTDARSNPRTGCHNIIEFFQSAEVSVIRPPQSLAPPSTGRVVIFDTDTHGDLGEIVGGHVVNWSIEATSTEGEILDVSGASPGDPITVANPTINLTIDYAKTVYEDGTPLTEGVDFDWTATEVDFIAPKPIVGSEVYTVDYAHDAQSTITNGEALDVTGLSPGDNVAVANPNINLTSGYPKKVYENGIALTEGADFDFTATEIDFLGAFPVNTETYTVDYAHDAQVPALPGVPAHGTLLNATSITDAEGLAQCRVRYADDSALVGGRDRVSAQADP